MRSAAAMVVSVLLALSLGGGAGLWLAHHSPPQVTGGQLADVLKLNEMLIQAVAESEKECQARVHAMGAR